VNAGLRLSEFGVFHEKNKSAYNFVPSAYKQSLAEALIVDPVSGELLDATTQKPFPVESSTGTVDPRVINGIVQCGVNGTPDGCMSNGHMLFVGNREQKWPTRYFCCWAVEIGEPHSTYR
jgi:hypothetical protein